MKPVNDEAMGKFDHVGLARRHMTGTEVMRSGANLGSSRL